MTGINPIGYDPGNSILSTGEAKYGDNPFLSLLITQLRNQTPLEPVDNESFMQQMATFSSMEEQKELNDNMLKLLNYQGLLARLQGFSEGSALLGKKVTYQTSGGDERSGVVDSVFINDQGEVLLRIGEREVGMSQVTGVENVKEKSPDKDPEENKDKGNEKPQ